MSERGFIRHVVFFSAKDPADRARVYEGLSILKQNPHARVLEVVENTRVDSWSGEVDVVVYGEFDDAEALAAYKAHPLYQQSIDLVKPLRELRIAADF